VFGTPLPARPCSIGPLWRERCQLGRSQTIWHVREILKLRNTTLKLYLKTLELRRAIDRLLRNERGQDLIEYALVVALIAFAAAAGMSAVASKINDAFTNVGTKVSTYTS